MKRNLLGLFVTACILSYAARARTRTSFIRG